MNNLSVGFLIGVILPLTMIYLLDGIGVITLADKTIPAVLIIGGAIALFILVEITKPIAKILSRKKE
jgi:hypothetical protein